MNQFHKYDAGKENSQVHWNGLIQLPSCDVKEAVKRIDGWLVEERPCDGQILLKAKPNLVVAIGVQQAGDRNFGIGGPPAVVSRIGVDNGITNPTTTSVSSDAGGGTDTGSSTQTLRTFDSTATRTNGVVTAAGTFNDPTTAGIGAVGFIMKRLFLSRHAANITNTTSADAANSLYSMTNVFTIDFTGISTWTAVFAAQVTLTGT